MADSLVSQSSILINSPSRALLSYSPYPYPYPAGVRLRLKYTSNSSISTRFANRVSRCFIKEIEDLNNGIGEFKSAIDGQACASGTVSVVDWADQEELMEPIAQESIFGDTILTELLVQSEEEQNHFKVFQVQSEEEQDAMAATPAHPAGLYALYASFFAGNLVEQIWSFAWPAAVALLHPSLLPVAVVGFVTKLGIFVGGPLVGQFMDSFPRVLAFNLLSTVQTAAQLLSASMIIYALNKYSHTTAASASALLVQPWFVILVIAGAVERLTGLATAVAFERDWVVLLAGINRPIALARANAMLSRVDLLCEIAGASIFGILLSKFGPVRSLKLAGAMMMCTLPILMFSVCLTDRLSKNILERPKCHVTHNESSINTSGTDPANLVKRGLDAIWCGWLQYKTQPVLPVSLACMLLYFNAVLAPGGLMTAYLTQRGLNPSIIGGFSGLCAFTGVAATFISASLVKKLGLLKAGAAGLVFQALPLGVAVVVYWSGLLTQQKSLLFFLFLIVLSRLGHMSYDIVGGQILQTAIPPSQANLIGTIEVSMASLAELIMLGIAIIVNDVSHFGFLALLSLVAVSGAAFIYCRWLLRVKGSKPINSHIPYNSDFVGKELARDTTN